MSAPLTPQEDLDLELIDSEYHDKTLFLTYDCQRTRVVITFYLGAYPARTLTGRVILKYLSVKDREEERKAYLAALLRTVIRDGGLQELKALRRIPVVPPGTPETLRTFLYPDRLSFSFISVDTASAFVGQPYPLERRIGLEFLDIVGLKNKREHYTENTIIAEKLGAHGVNAVRVVVDKQDRYCTIARRTTCKGLTAEYNTLCHIEEIIKDLATIRVPRLSGLMARGKHDKRYIGFLQEFIPTDVENLHTLAVVDPLIVSEERRVKWGTQIIETVNQMHEIGMVWGACDPKNILIHKDTDDIVCINFFGSKTYAGKKKIPDNGVDADLRSARQVTRFLKVYALT